MKRRNERQKGFTLIELLVVLIVIAVLAAVLVPALTSYLDDAREKKAVSEAQVCVTAATEWAAVQRTALISQAYKNNQTFADAYNAAGNTAKWSNDYAALNTAAPTVTGTPALAEGDGQYFLRPETTSNDTTTDEMKNTVKAAAGVDGKLQKLQLNADGKVLYLLYTSAEGITVAYTAAGTAQTPDTTVPVATLPEDTTPKPPTPSHSGDLVFCVLNEYTGDPVPGIKFHVLDEAGKTVFGSQATDDKGMVYFDLDVSGWDTRNSNNKKFTLCPDDWPVGYQQVFNVEFNISAYKSGESQTYNSYEINGIDKNINHEPQNNYKDGTIGTLDGGAYRHLYTFYARTVPTLELRVWDDGNKKLVENVNFTLSKDGKSIPITSGLTNTVLDVKLHEKDNLRPGSENKCLDMSQYGNYAKLLVNFTKVPKGYQYFDNCYLEIKLENQPEHNWQLSTAFQEGQTVNGNQAHTKIECKDVPNENKSIVTIHVQGGKDVNFFVYDGLDNVHTTQLPNAKLQLRKQDGAVLATFTTDENGKPNSAENFTETLPVGDYTLHLESGLPTGYDPPADIPFTIKPGAGGLLTIAGTGANASCVDNAKSTVTMLVTKHDTKRIQLQVVDAITGKPWAGVNVKVTGGSLNATDDSKRYYAIDSLAKNTQTFDWSTLDKGDITVIIAGSDNPGDFEKDHHNRFYTNNFVGSKYVFHLSKNSDGTVTLTETTKKEKFNGEISPDGSTVKVYAYPQVIVDFNTKGVFAGVGIAGRKSILHIVTSDGAIPTTVNGKELSTWEVKPDNHNHSVGLSLGSYKLYEERETYGYYKILNLPLEFKVTRQANGFPAVTNPDGSPILDYDTKLPYKDEKGNILPKITAWYESIAHVGS